MPCGLKNTIAFALLLFISLPVMKGQDNPVKGSVLSSEDYSPLHNVHIVNLSANRGVVSGADGKFIITAKPTDTLVFSSVGFYDTIFIVETPGEITVIMTPAVYPIGEVTILPYKTYAEFKQAFKNMEVEKPMQFDESYFSKGEARPSDKPGFGLTIDGPITALYNAFSREGKQRRNYERYMRESAVWEEVGRRYNVQIVRRITGIENDMEAIKFMQYCRFDNQFVLQSTQYELLAAVKQCYEAYLAEK